MRTSLIISALAALPLATLTATAAEEPAQTRDPYLDALTGHTEESDWQMLFNGENLDNWTPKFTGQEVGVNYNDTFQVRDGLLCVTYENWDEGFDGEFGHLFVDGEFSHYVLRAEYRIDGDQIDGGPSWARRNNGLMIHGQTPEEMSVDQEFPVSIEVQILGGDDGGGGRTTGNICTPGTHISQDGQQTTAHVINSQYEAPAPEEWVTIEVVVNGSEEIRHYINGEEVIRYQDIVLDDGTPLSEGTISIQAESSLAEFRRIVLLPLSEEDFEAAEETVGAAGE